MEFMSTAALAATNMATAQVSQSYAISMQKRAMVDEVVNAKELMDMLPQQTPAVPKGELLDVYA